MTTQVATMFHVRVVFNGVIEPLNVQSHEQITAVLNRAEDLFHITQNRHTLALFRPDGTEISEGQSVIQAGLTPGELLGLRTSRVKGGVR
jgi:hypothetical protein